MAEAMEIMLLSLLSPALVCEWGISNSQQVRRRYIRSRRDSDLCPRNMKPDCLPQHHLQALGTTCVFIGWMVSSPVWGWFFDTHGRKTVSYRNLPKATVSHRVCSAPRSSAAWPESQPRRRPRSQRSCSSEAVSAWRSEACHSREYGRSGTDFVSTVDLGSSLVSSR